MSQKTAAGGIWKCPQCETINYGTDTCAVCGYRPQSDPFSGPGIYNPRPEKRSGKLKITVILSILVLAAVVAAGLIYYFQPFQSQETDTSDPVKTTQEKDTTAASDADNNSDKVDDTGTDAADNTVYYVINTNRDGMFVRSGPGKQYTVLKRIAYGDTSVRMRDLEDNRTDSYGYTWYHIGLDDGTTGYVRSDIVKRADSY